MNIGEYIKSVRKSRGLSREDLTDICSVKTLYRTENSKTLPSSSLLEKLTKRFGVDFVGYFASINHESEISPQLKKEIESLDSDRNFDNLFKLTSEMRETAYFSTNTDNQYIDYYYIKSYYMTTHNKDITFNFIRDKFNYNEDTFDLSKIDTHFSFIELKALLLTTYIMVNWNEYERCKRLLSTFDLKNLDLGKYPIGQCNDLLKVTYNQALATYYTEDYQRTKEIISHALVVCEKYSLFDRLARFYWLYAYYYFEVDDIDNCHKYCDLFLKISEIKNETYVLNKYIKVFKEKFFFDYNN